VCSAGSFPLHPCICQMGGAVIGAIKAQVIGSKGGVGAGWVVGDGSAWRRPTAPPDRVHFRGLCRDSGCVPAGAGGEVVKDQGDR